MSHNPSIQCATCGKWMRLHGVDRATGNAYQRFYGSWMDKAGEHHAHDGDVCVPCESKLPNWNGYPHPMLKENANV